MNIYLQIGIGLLPGMIAILMILFKRKAFRVKNILWSLLFTVICGLFLGLGVVSVLENGTSQSKISKKEMLAFANALVLEGACDLANEVIDDYSEVYGYDDECRLLAARMSLFKQDYKKAKGLYTYLCENSKVVNSDSQEVTLANNNIDALYSELLEIEYLMAQNQEIEEYGYSKDYYKEIKKKVKDYDFEDEIEELEEVITEEFEISSDMRSYAETVKELIDSEKEVHTNEGMTTKYKRVFKNMQEESPELLQLSCVSNARIKAYVMAGSYEEFVKEIDSNASYHELMVAAELYMGGFVENKDFNKEYVAYSKDDLILLEEELEDFYQGTKEEYTSSDRKKLKARIEEISVQMKNLELSQIEEQLLENIPSMSDSNQTKVYLEVSKIEHYFNDESGTDKYLSEAIYSSPDNKDDAYVYAMSEIINVLENNEEDDLENIKNVSDYIDTVLDNSLTVDIEEILSSRKTGGAASTSGEEQFSFEQTAVDYVSRARSAVSIGKIDTSEFETITAKVQISSDYATRPEELKNIVTIYDCGTRIKDFTIEKIDYSGTKIILLCDVSGSMSGSIQDLQNAVITFVEDRNDSEEMAVVAFDDSIVDIMGFETSDATKIDFAKSMYAGGGTNIFSSVLESMHMFPGDFDSNDVLIVMTDGQDSSRNLQQIKEQIGTLAVHKGITIYTLGLGSSVDTAYLNTIAASGNGEFLYVSDSTSLTNFYNMLHEQLNNQYKITYKAADTYTLSNRTLEVCVSEENKKDIKTYSLTGEETESGQELEASQGVTISGLMPKHVYKSSKDVIVKLRGTNFALDAANPSKGKEINVNLNGNIDYKIEAEYVDQNTYNLTIPSSIAVGDYNVEIAIDGKKIIIDNGLSVLAQGVEKTTQFGPYVFTSNSKVANNNGSITLSGGVCLNGWLRFKGDVILAGDVTSGGSVTVTERQGSYVLFDKATAEGLGAFFAEKGIQLDIPALGTFKLYNDPDNIYDYEKYKADEIRPVLLKVHQFMKFDSPVLKLYPNSIGLYFSTGTTILPYQDKIMDLDDLFSFSLNANAQLTDRNLGIVLEASYGDPDDTFDHKINFFNSPMYINASADLKVNTIKNEYTIGTMIHTAFVAEQCGIGAEVTWKGNLIPNAVKIAIDPGEPIPLPTTFPTEIKDFAFEASEIDTVVKEGNLAKIKLTGETSLSSMAISRYLPKLAKVIGNDLSVLEMPNTTATIGFSPFSVEADATLKFLSEIKLAEAGIKLGVFEVTNSLLGFDSAEVTGLSARVKAGIMWDTADGRIKLELSGQGEVDAHSRFVGADIKGTAEYDIGWWIIHSDKKLTGEFALGLHTTNAQKKQLVFVYRAQDSKGKVSGKFYYIDENGKCGKEKGTLS